MRKDYRTYHFSGKEWLLLISGYSVLDGVISYLFFDSLISFVCLLPGIWLFMNEIKGSLVRKRREQIGKEFLDGMRMTATSLQAGYSIENAFREALPELRKMYEPDSFIVMEFAHLVAQTGLNRTLEDILSDLGMRSGVEDIRNFAEVFETSRKTGGELLTVVRSTISGMSERQETLAQIRTQLAGKEMEQNIMSLMPILILAYVRFSSPGFLDPMYGTGTGITVMTVCLVLYVIAWIWGRRIVQIEV